MNIVEEIIYRMFNFYNVNSIKDLAKKINTPKSTISNWKQRKSISPLRKKCFELGIYADIFENINEHGNKINHKNINAKLFLFNRKALIYFYYTLKKENFKNAVDYFEWNEKLDKNNKFKAFLSELFIDTVNKNLVLSLYRKETNNFINILLTIDEIDYIFSNKEQFLNSIFFIIEQKR